MKTPSRLPLALVGLATTAVLALAPLAPAAADTVDRSLPVANAPWFLAATPDGSKLVSVGFAQTVSIVDVASGVESAPVALGATAYNVAVSPNGATAIVPTTSGDLFFIDTASGIVTGPISLGSYFFDVAFTSDSTRAYVSTGSNVVLVVDVAARAVVDSITVASGPLFGLALMPDGSSILVSDLNLNLLYRPDVATDAILATFSAPAVPTEVTVTTDGTRAYVGSFISGQLGSIDLGTGVSTSIPLAAPGPLSSIALTPDDGLLYVPRGFGNRVSIVDTVSNTEIAPLATGASASGIAFTADGTTAFVGDADAPAVLVVAVDRPPLLAAAAPAATVGVAYSFAAGIGGSPAPTYAVSAGSLPAGLTLDTATGAISGTPTALGATTFSVTATNAVGTATQAYTLTVAAAAALADSGPAPEPLLLASAALLLLGLALLAGRRQSRQGTSGAR